MTIRWAMARSSRLERPRAVLARICRACRADPAAAARSTDAMIRRYATSVSSRPMPLRSARLSASNGSGMGMCCEPSTTAGKPTRHRSEFRAQIRYPDGSRVRKRVRREREAMRVWSAEQTKIENGTWHEQTPKRVTFESALKLYREYSTVQNRSHRSYVEPALSVWEAHITPSTLLAKVTTALVEDVKLRRAQSVAHPTVDKDVAVLKAFFSWCMARNLAASNPVSRVK